MKLKRNTIFLSLILVFSFINAQNCIQYKMIVAQDGSGDFTTINSATVVTKAFPE